MEGGRGISGMWREGEEHLPNRGMWREQFSTGRGKKMGKKQCRGEGDGWGGGSFGGSFSNRRARMNQNN